MQKLKIDPTAKIAVKNNVVKHYNMNGQNTVYLSNNSEFSIELFNPTTDVILAEIKLNGKYTSSEGLILNPGERVFLERYLNKDVKYKFNTYNVEDSNEAKNAIQNNGLVEVSFYKERDYYQTMYRSPTLDARIYFSDLVTTTSYCCLDELSSKSIETGRVDEGDKSDQAFISVSKEFEEYPFHIETIKLLPDSTKVYTVKDLKHKKYCTECGSKIKQTDKFCSQCGNKI